ncbi:LysR family transcriptional regulator [Gordonia sp. ABSL1-1]|uniref:LysR family transcriptional regulator n=1 Tax=Gordonia sp. ABSL1-1 TaxID=3053923 RepID=UPI002572DA43|nr:LysR family transcriptional regulator [Gordonia sp. ABSL1-1]MDL9935609.1 LysR family transcriptional regulator [Gordonia sp. ABSL1-1]
MTPSASDLGPAVAGLDSRRLAQFVGVVESSTLAEAAARLFITQQALSAALRSLERDLGVILFDRSRRSLQPTEAGKALYAGARPLLAGTRALADEVRRVANGSPEPFVIGHSPALSGAEVHGIIERGLDVYPDRSVTARPVFPSAFEDELMSGAADLILRRGVGTPQRLASAIVTYHLLRVAVSAQHPLAGRSRIAMADLGTYPIMVWAPEHRSFYTDYLLAHCRRCGIEPVLKVNPIQGTPPSTAVLRDHRVCAFVTDEPGALHGGRAEVIDLDAGPLVPVQALWLPHTESPFRTALLGATATGGPPSPEDV